MLIAGGCAGQKQPVANPTANITEAAGQKTDDVIPTAQENRDTGAAPPTPASETEAVPLSPESNPDPANQLVLQISRDFGRTVLFAQTVYYHGNASLLDLMKAHLQVETGYGGSFINSINGLSSSSGGFGGARQDWFVYINGICSDVGVQDYDPRNAQVIWWDYHRWKSGPSISALIGSYPEPFLHGYRGNIKPSLIMVAGGDLSIAGALQQSLKSQDVAQINITNIDENSLVNRSGPTIVVGEWGQLQSLNYLDKFNQAYKRNGTGIHFTDQGLELLDWNGQVQRSVAESVGVVVASGAGLGDDSPLWLVAGTDPIGLQYALDLFKDTGKIKGLYGAAITSGELIPLPLQ